MSTFERMRLQISVNFSCKNFKNVQSEERNNNLSIMSKYNKEAVDNCSIWYGNKKVQFFNKAFLISISVIVIRRDRSTVIWSVLIGVVVSSSGLWRICVGRAWGWSYGGIAS